MDFLHEQVAVAVAESVSCVPSETHSSELNELQLTLVGGGIGDFIPY
jgi:hypothetical protein